MYSLEEFEMFWEKTGQHGTQEERITRAKAWLPYYAYVAKTMNAAAIPNLEDEDSFPAFLIREGLVHPEDSVLDIGAGMGGDSLCFAAHCRAVTALELSSDCLEVLRLRASSLGLQNIELTQMSWEEYRPKQRYDVSYSSMCPAICNAEELRRMEQMTKRLCCIVTVLRGSYDRHRKAMMEELGIRPQGGMVTELIHYFNVLYMMGRQPNVWCQTEQREYSIPAEKILEQYPIYFKIFGVSEQESVSFLRDYLSRHGQDGFLREESQIHYGLLWWQVSAQ